MTAAPHLAIGTTLQGLDDCTFSAFQLVNGPLTTQLVTGNIFFGIQGYFAVVIPLGEAPNLALARGGKILTDLTNCTVGFTADGNFAAGQILVNCMLDSSPRYGPLDSRLAWKPPGGYTSPSGWRQDIFGVFDQILEDTGGTPFFDDGTGNTGWGINIIAGSRDELAGKFVVPAGPGWSVARAKLALRRFGNPTGSMEVAIQGSTTDAEGHVLPDGVDLGVSSTVANNTVPVNPGIGTMVFPFAPDIVLAPGTYFTVLRPAVAYTPDFANWISWMQKRAFLGVGAAHRHSLDTPTRLDQHNYPGHADLSLDLGTAVEAGPAVTWDIPATTAGQTRVTPDLSALVQEVILREAHETASALCFTFRSVGQTTTFRFAAHDHATRSPPTFFAQYSRRQCQVYGGL